MKYICSLFIALVFCGCCSFSEKRAVSEAVQMINSGKAECVLIKDGKIKTVMRGGGVNPLLAMYEREKTAMRGGTVADKVIGRAAASVVICSGAKSVHGIVMSEDALAFLEKHNVKASYDTLVPRILNKKRDGLCPLEKAVEPYSEPEKALDALKAKVASFGKK